MTGSLCFYSQKKVTNFNTDIWCWYWTLILWSLWIIGAKFLGNTVADGSNGILRNTKITVPLKQLGTFCGLLEMYFINYKVELKI